MTTAMESLEFSDVDNDFSNSLRRTRTAERLIVGLFEVAVGWFSEFAVILA